MLDLKLIRDEPDTVDAALKRRGLDAVSANVLSLDSERRDLQTRMQDLQQQRNQASKAIGDAKRKGEDASEAMAAVAKIKDDIQRLTENEEAVGERLKAILETLPNLPATDVPDGADESENLEVKRIGEPRRDNDLKDHVDIGEALGQIDFSAAADLSGSRFVLLRGDLARLERALGQFMLDLHSTEHGYQETAPPFLVRSDALYGTGQLPKFAEDLFHTTSDHWLIPTAEVPLTNLVADKILEEVELPYRFTALTPCFRSEAGSAGRDTRGMLRQHQFAKVEMVSITTPEQSVDEHERMTQCAETVLQRLELPYRVVSLCTGDLGFAARKTYDLEVWLPGQNTYREISSCSNCGDFQALRMKARYRPEGSKSTRPVHTLNGSGVAVGRALIAVIENHQQADGRVAIPDVLRPYMGGKTHIEPLK
ncbi:MAG TPA: serine--tRNA ligase [Rhodospirillaceae bacterium]|nr:serine--tRNA ligase [Alphaproteobacteria bacterium]OUT42409.1 MAG: serine--tRNA ligase [Micavibrio sp. TMED2]HCI45828.1 serine--tRNA ligase [Rhodospirillaceae bacterium]MAS45951.1 serine--tRNA ligase [Alphaproteobacteria bacterium]MAX95867.1 serine--tRNA ligase [Alphaproteobacteria bacterium]|tara:strand:+ start:6478 stop:7752 length:1275 start_codon:yes stop_codon:yes gene_type:complete